MEAACLCGSRRWPAGPRPNVAQGATTNPHRLSPNGAPQTIRFKSELVRNITIKLGYANAKIYRSTTA